MPPVTRSATINVTRSATRNVTHSVVDEVVRKHLARLSLQARTGMDAEKAADADPDEVKYQGERSWAEKDAEARRDALNIEEMDIVPWHPDDKRRLKEEMDRKDKESFEKWLRDEQAAKEATETAKKAAREKELQDRAAENRRYRDKKDSAQDEFQKKREDETARQNLRRKQEAEEKEERNKKIRAEKTRQKDEANKQGERDFKKWREGYDEKATIERRKQEYDAKKEAERKAERETEEAKRAKIQAGLARGKLLTQAQMELKFQAESFVVDVSGMNQDAMEALGEEKEYNMGNHPIFTPAMIALLVEMLHKEQESMVEYEEDKSFAINWNEFERWLKDRARKN